MTTESKTLEISELEKYILLLVYIDDEPVYGRKKLQFIMYMLGDPYPEIREWCNYTIQDDGPYSKILDDTLDQLVQLDLLVERDDTIQLTKQSTEYAKVIADEKGGILEVQNIFDIKMPYVFSEHKDIVNDVTLPEMLSFMYCEYPEIAQGSKTYEKLKPDIEEHIFSLLAKEKFSGGRAAELLGKPIHIMMDEMGKRGLLVLEP